MFDGAIYCLPTTPYAFPHCHSRLTLFVNSVNGVFYLFILIVCIHKAQRTDKNDEEVLCR